MIAQHHQVTPDASIGSDHHLVVSGVGVKIQITVTMVAVFATPDHPIGYDVK